MESHNRVIPFGRVVYSHAIAIWDGEISAHQFFSTLPGYVNSNVIKRSPKAETEACLTLVELERLLVRYIVDHYNQSVAG